MDRDFSLLISGFGSSVSAPTFPVHAIDKCTNSCVHDCVILGRYRAPLVVVHLERRDIRPTHWFLLEGHFGSATDVRADALAARPSKISSTLALISPSI